MTYKLISDRSGLKRILFNLVNDKKLTYSDIAKKTRLSFRRLKQRLYLLESNGLIIWIISNNKKDKRIKGHYLITSKGKELVSLINNIEGYFK